MSFVGFLLLLKGPFLLKQQITNGDFSLSNFGKGLLMGQASPSVQYQTPLTSERKQLASKSSILLASNSIYDRLLAQVSSDQ
jgi:hypothetical protein